MITDNYELLKKGIIKELKYDPRKVEDAIKLSERDLRTALSLLEIDPDWAYNIAYNSMLQATRALMFHNGFRPSGSNQHVAVVKYAEIHIEKKWSLQLDRMRRKRHSLVYDQAGVISDTEVINALNRAESYFRVIENIIRTS
ncbi:HEPN domain-containing protein [Methanoplanus endosymbiosus]|uniref:HEPN domain-containing protein n=1 Tax=Methanoplanus endosymbiosus TaxID=33865 RepID=A0A9E7PPC6_9EURY|nr:HEPN domain-containing protein [Methanoplanus endosymbiosus]UUX92591.1 HEPN domain-containing protein [Methanoplanus endosymbiosus]